MPRKTLFAELENFYKVIGKPILEIGKSAFSQARKKLKYHFFIDWNDELINLYYFDNERNIRTWNGFKLFAVDGSTMNLLDREDVVDYFGTMKNQHGSVSMGRISCRYDVLNNIAIHTSLGSIHTSEKDMAIERLSEVGADVINIYDRHYMSFELAFLHIKYGTQFVIRCKLSFSNIVKQFVSSKEESQVVEIAATSKAIQNLKARGYKKEEINKNTTIKVRFVKVWLDNGELELLCTSLLDEEKYPTSCFKELYAKRWGVETYFDIIKNRFLIELFSGQTVQAILQDFHATIFVSNVQSLLNTECEPALEVINERRTTHNYQVNTNASIGCMKDTVILMFLFAKDSPKEQRLEYITQAIKKLTVRFLKNIEPIRPNRTPKRKKRKRNQRGKYRTLNNYKRAI